MIRFKCERCAAPIRCPDTDAGKPVVCPTCQHRQTAPKPAPGRRPSRLLLVGGAAAAVALLAWLAWSMLGPEKPPSGAADIDPSAAAAKDAAGQPRPPAPFEGVPAKADPRDATERAWAEQEKLHEQRRLDERGVREWEAAWARERETERIEREIRLEKEREERARLEFERNKRLKEAEEERRRLLHQQQQQQTPRETPP